MPPFILPIRWILALEPQFRILFRALSLSVHSSFGTTYTAILRDISIAVYVLLRQRSRHRSSRNWFRAMKKEWKDNLRDGVYAVLVWFVGMTLYNVSIAMHENRVFSAQDIEDYGYGLAVSIANDSNKPTTIGTGFWVNEKGYMVTCTHKLKNGVPGTSELGVGSLLAPLLTGKLLTVAAGFRYARGTLVSYDDETGLALFFVKESPFQMTMHMFADAQDIKTHKVERTIEKCYVADVSREGIQVGDKIFLVGVEDENGSPALNTAEGQIERLGADTSSKARFLRIHTSIPFKPTYWGSPVLNASEQVVGIVGDSTDQAVVIPAQYILELLTHEQLVKH
jgi:S1-C subfamily serine protease